MLCWAAFAAAAGACEPPKVIPRCPGFEELQCDDERRVLCAVVAADGCLECVCERLWSDIRTDKTAAESAPAATPPSEGEGEGEAESDDEPAPE